MRHRLEIFRNAALAVAVSALPVVLATGAAAQQQAEHADPIAMRLFAPELIMAHADEIGLSGDQRQRIIAEVARLQTEAASIGRKGESATAKMVAALDEKAVEEARVLEALDGILSVEREIKRLHIATLVRIRNVLSASQRDRLTSLR